MGFMLIMCLNEELVFLLCLFCEIIKLLKNKAQRISISLNFKNVYPLVLVITCL